MTDKIVKLTKVSEKQKPETYEQAIQRHLDSLLEEQRQAAPGFLFVGSMGEFGTSYQILSSRNVLEAIGALEVLKEFILYDSLEEQS